MFFDEYYLILVVPALIISVVCQIMVSVAFGKYKTVGNSKGLTGADVAQQLMSSYGINDVRIERVSGKLTDHYDPRTKVLRLSDSVYGSTSVAAIGVAAHETGHAIQHANAYGPLWLRSILVPAARIGSSVGPYMAVIGLIVGIGALTDFGILLFGAAVLFYLITLPVEINASTRALAMLRENQILSEDEMYGSKKVLQAAAMTYVASALVAVANLARLMLLRGRRRR